MTGAGEARGRSAHGGSRPGHSDLGSEQCTDTNLSGHEPWVKTANFDGRERICRGTVPRRRILWWTGRSRQSTSHRREAPPRCSMRSLEDKWRVPWVGATAVKDRVPWGRQWRRWRIGSALTLRRSGSYNLSPNQRTRNHHRLQSRVAQQVSRSKCRRTYLWRRSMEERSSET